MINEKLMFIGRATTLPRTILQENKNFNCFWHYSVAIYILFVWSPFFMKQSSEIEMIHGHEMMPHVNEFINTEGGTQEHVAIYASKPLRIGTLFDVIASIHGLADTASMMNLAVILVITSVLCHGLYLDISFVFEIWIWFSNRKPTAPTVALRLGDGRYCIGLLIELLAVISSTNKTTNVHNISST
ncbi:hypothetical protein ACJX0J_010119 [Zea mays]